jgi:hypothetical protein
MIPCKFPDRRFQLALGLSVAAHVLLAGSWGGGAGGAAVPQMPLQARLDTSLAVAADTGFAEEPVAATMPSPPVTLRSGDDRRPVRLPAAAAPGSDTAGADTRFYLARELDQYPEAPELRQVAAVAHVRVWVGIDQQGRVVDVAAADPGHPVAAIRERLLAIRFVPARKDGRPVRSRVLMEWPER